MSGSNSTGSQVTRLTKPLRKYSVAALDRGVEQFANYRGQELPSTYVPISQQREQALQGMMNPNAQYGPAMDEWQKTVSGHYLDPTTNPYFQRMADDATGASMARVAGNFGTFGMGGPNSIMGTMASDIGAATKARLYSDMYNPERQRMMGAIEQAPQMMAMQYADAGRMGQVGMEYERDAASQNAETMRQFEYPLKLAQMEQGFLAGSPLMNESFTKGTGPGFDWMGLVGGLAGSLMPQPSSMFGGTA